MSSKLRRHEQVEHWLVIKKVSCLTELQRRNSERNLVCESSEEVGRHKNKRDSREIISSRERSSRDC